MEQEKLHRVSYEVERKYKDILKSNGINHEVYEIYVNENPVEGAGLLSLQNYVTVQFVNRNIKPLQLFVKICSKGRQNDEAHKAMKLIDTECQFFMEYIPAVTNFCKSKGLENFLSFYPKCYYGDMESIVFENLVLSSGYILLSKKDRLDLEPAKLALAALAKHHAISQAFIKELELGANSFREKFPNLCYEIYEQPLVQSMVEPCIENGITTNIKILDKHIVEGKDEAIALLKAHIGRGFQMIRQTIQHRPEDEKILTLNHGDFWVNNMMFLRDENTNELHSPKIFDLQLTRFNSPALDIGNLMYTSMKPEVRRAHLEEMLKLYHEVLLDTAAALGAPIQLTYDELFHLYRRKFMYGFWFSIWLCADVSYQIINEVELNAEKDPSDWATRFDKKFQKWSDENPVESEQFAVSLVKLMKEYSNLVLN